MRRRRSSYYRRIIAPQQRLANVLLHHIYQPAVHGKIYLNSHSMPTNNPGIVKHKRDRTNENFSKRLQTVIDRCGELAQFNADVYLLVRRGKIWEYKTLKCDCWPLSSKEIVSVISLVHIDSANQSQRRITTPYRSGKHLQSLYQRKRRRRRR